MDGAHFDQLTRALAIHVPLRKVVFGLLAGLAGGAVGGPEGAGAACSNLKKPCTQASDCCSG